MSVTSFGPRITCPAPGCLCITPGRPCGINVCPPRVQDGWSTDDGQVQKSHVVLTTILRCGQCYLRGGARQGWEVGRSPDLPKNKSARLVSSEVASISGLSPRSRHSSQATHILQHLTFKTRLQLLTHKKPLLLEFCTQGSLATCRPRDTSKGKQLAVAVSSPIGRSGTQSQCCYSCCGLSSKSRASVLPICRERSGRTP